MPVAPARPRSADGVVVAVDPHKASWAAVVVDASLIAVAALRVAANRAGYRQLRRFTAAWPHARWAIEGAAGLGAPLTERLHADETAVIDVPANWPAGCDCCRLVNRLHALLVRLIPSGLPRALTADATAEALRRVRPRHALGRTLRQLAAELRRLDRRVAHTTQALRDAVADSGTTPHRASRCQ